MIDDFYGDATGSGLWKRAAGGAVEAGPNVLVDLRLEGGFEGFVGIVLAEEIGVADEKAFLVVIAVDEPASDAFRAAADDCAGIGFKDIDA